MIPTVAVPNIQVAPTPVLASLFTGSSMEPALGRLPMNVVPAPVSNAKVADDGRGGQTPARNPQVPVPANDGFADALSSSAGKGELSFESPYSTVFVAQLFGQFEASGGESSGTDMFGTVVDFDQLAQFDMIKYKPSMAFKPSENPTAPQVEMPELDALAAMRQASTEAVVQSGLETAPAQPLTADSPVASTDSAPQESTVQAQQQPVLANFSAISSNVMDAYSSTQARNQIALDASAARDVGRQEVSLIS